MHRTYTAAFALAGIALLVAGSVAAQIVIQEEEEISGTVVSLSDSRIAIRDDSGQLHNLLIQSPDKRGVALTGGAALRFPAEVHVVGRYTIDSLERGDSIKLEVPLNRRGEVDDAANAVWRISANDQSPGVYPQDEPADARDFVTCQIVGSFSRLAKNRLLLQVPRNDFVRKKILSIPIAAKAEVRSESADHRAAAPGAVVEQAVVANLNTGDRVIRKLRVSMSTASSAQRTFDDELALKHRRLSDEPVPPRLIRSRHFMIQTDISERQAAILTEKLERMVTLLSKYFGARPTGLVQAYVVHDLSQWPQGMLTEPAGIAKIEEGAGVCFSRRSGSQAEAIVYSCDDHGVVQHESTHAFCTLTFGSTGPTWLAEGVAEMGQYWKSDEVAVNIDPMVLQYLKNATPKRTLAEIALPGRTSAGGWQDYAWRWALCHLLANNPNYSDRFKPLAIALMTEQEGASFAAAYGDVEREISFEYDQFLSALDNGYDARLAAWQWGRRFVPLRGSRSVKSKVLAKAGWQPTGARLSASETYAAKAEGEWKLSAKGNSLSAIGEEDGRGRLVGVLMNDFALSAPFDLGTETTFTAPSDGDLYVRCQDDWHSLSDNSGEVEMSIQLAE